LLLEALARRLRQQLNARDRKLVEQTEGLILYKPYSGGKISWGMFEEIRHRNTFVKYGLATEAQRPAVIVSPASARAQWRIQVLVEELRSQGMVTLGERLEKNPDKLCRVSEALASDVGVAAGLESGQLSGTTLRTCVEEVCPNFHFAGMPAFRGPLDGTAGVRKARWLDGKWGRLAREACNKDHIGEERLRSDLVLEEAPPVQELVAKLAAHLTRIKGE